MNKELLIKINKPVFNNLDMIESYGNHVVKFKPTRHQSVPISRSNEYFGWSLMNSTGNVEDDVKRPKHRNPTSKYFTPACDEYFKNVIKTLEDQNFEPRRCRILQLNNSDKLTMWGSGNKPNTWRIHIPIYTTPEAMFEWEYEGNQYSYHIPADGSMYAVRIDIPHRHVNYSINPRIHFVCGTTYKFSNSFPNSTTLLELES